MDADNPTIRWSSNAPSIVSVVEDSTDIVTIKGVQEGNAIIKAAATDGSGVESTCNVVVKPAGPTPYPEGANYYVPSVENYKRDIADSPTIYTRLTFIDENGDELEIIPIEVTSTEYNAGRQKFQLMNITRQQLLEEYTFINRDDVYIIGSTTNNSYVEIKNYKYPTYSSSNAKNLDFYIHYTRDNETGNRGWLILSDANRINYVETAFILEDSVLKRYMYSGARGASRLYYYSGESYNPQKAAFDFDGYYNENGTRVTLSSVLPSGVDWLIKFNIIKNGIKVREDYAFRKSGKLYNAGSLLKIQNEDGTYSYYTRSYQLIDESQFPVMDVTYEITFDITNV